VGETSLAELQANDPDIGPIVRLRLEQTERPHSDSLISESPFAKRLCSEWDSLEVIDGVVYRRFQYNDGRSDVLQLLLPRVMRKDFLAKTHAGMNGGHLGIRRTLDQVRRRAFWQGWRRDTQIHCRQCANCNSYFRGKLPRTAPLQPLLSGAPFERLHIDLTGPHPTTTRKSRFIVSIICPFTKWAECFPVHSKEASVIARIVVEQVICRFGVPLSMLTDNAKELDGDLMTEICRLLKIEKFRTTVYKPSTNAAVERFHRTLNSMLAKMIETEKDWDLMLPFVMAAYRSSRHESTEFTPNFLMLGREVHSPVDIVYGTPEAKIHASYPDYSEEMLNRFQRAYALVREHLREAAKRSKRYYDMHVRAKEYQVGDWVMYYNPRKRLGRQDKWVHKYAGPYLVVKILGPVNVVIQKTKRGREIVTHLDKLKPYVGEDVPTSWLQSGSDEGLTVRNPDGSGMDLVGEQHDCPVSENEEDGLGTLEEAGRLNPGDVTGETPVKTSAVSEPVGTREERERTGQGKREPGALDGQPSPFAIAGYPLSDPLPFRPKRAIRRPQRYSD